MCDVVNGTLFLLRIVTRSHIYFLKITVISYLKSYSHGQSRIIN